MYNEPIETKYFDEDATQKVAFHILLKHFSEAAAQDARNLSFGFEDLKDQNIVWIIARMQIEQAKAVQHGQKLNLKTWHAHSDKLLSRRDFIITDEAGQTVVKGASWWLLMDITKRKIVRATQDLIDKNPKTPDFIIQEAQYPNPKLQDMAPVKTTPIIARYSDMDINNHVNNTNYIAWAAESVPQDVLDTKIITKFMINFKNESKAGDKITAYTYADGPDAYWHSLVRESDGKELIRAHSVWGAR